MFLLVALLIAGCSSSGATAFAAAGFEGSSAETAAKPSSAFTDGAVKPATGACDNVSATPDQAKQAFTPDRLPSDCDSSSSGYESLCHFFHHSPGEILMFINPLYWVVMGLSAVTHDTL
jgi:hypothetical protein